MPGQTPRPSRPSRPSRASRQRQSAAGRSIAEEGEGASGSSEEEPEGEGDETYVEEEVDDGHGGTVIERRKVVVDIKPKSRARGFTKGFRWVQESKDNWVQRWNEPIRKPRWFSIGARDEMGGGRGGVSTKKV